MLFWLIVAAVVVVVLLLAWRADRRRKVTIDRRNSAVENDAAQGWAEAERNALRNIGPNGGP
jgi:hypothetical protein